MQWHQWNHLLQVTEKILVKPSLLESLRSNLVESRAVGCSLFFVGISDLWSERQEMNDLDSWCCCTTSNRVLITVHVIYCGFSEKGFLERQVHDMHDMYLFTNNCILLHTLAPRGHHVFIYRGADGSKVSWPFGKKNHPHNVPLVNRLFLY